MVADLELVAEDLVIPHDGNGARARSDRRGRRWGFRREVVDVRHDVELHLAEPRIMVRLGKLLPLGAEEDEDAVPDLDSEARWICGPKVAQDRSSGILDLVDEEPQQAFADIAEVGAYLVGSDPRRIVGCLRAGRGICLGVDLSGTRSSWWPV